MPTQCAADGVSRLATTSLATGSVAIAVACSMVVRVATHCTASQRTKLTAFVSMAITPPPPSQLSRSSRQRGAKMMDGGNRQCSKPAVGAPAVGAKSFGRNDHPRPTSLMSESSEGRYTTGGDFRRPSHDRRGHRERLDTTVTGQETRGFERPQPVRRLIDFQCSSARTWLEEMALAFCCFMIRILHLY